MQKKITKRVVDAATHADGWIWDTEVKGFGLRVSKGGVKSYLVGYRAGAGGRSAQKKRYTFGRHGSPWTPDEARTEAKRLLGQIADGHDPAAERKTKREASNLTELSKRFLSEHVEVKCKPRTVEEYRRLIELHVRPKLGNKSVPEITRDDIARFHQGLKNTPYQANRTLAVLGKMFEVAELWGICPDGSNPCRRIQKFPEKKRETSLTLEELSRLGIALSEYEGAPYAVAAIRLLTFTGARLNEILSLEWAWIDFERCVARLPDSKTGAKTIHLTPPAVEILKNLDREEKNPYVILGNKPGTHLVDLKRPWDAIREAAGLEHVRLHDLRHTFASVGVMAGMGLPIVGAILGHSQPQTTARYAHLAQDPVNEASAMIAKQIANAMGNAEQENYVVDINSAKGA